jgi:uncharacterized membrane protein
MVCSVRNYFSFINNGKKLSVVVAMLLAFTFLGESLTWKALLGGTLVAGGAVLLALP